MFKCSENISASHIYEASQENEPATVCLDGGMMRVAPMNEASTT